MTKTVHKWIKTSETTATTIERCNGHCPATAKRSKKTGHLMEFDYEGQLEKSRIPELAELDY